MVRETITRKNQEQWAAIEDASTLQEQEPEGPDLDQWAEVGSADWGTPDSDLPPQEEWNTDGWGCSEEEAETWERYQGYMEGRDSYFSDVER